MPSHNAAERQGLRRRTMALKAWGWVTAEHGTAQGPPKSNRKTNYR